MHLEAPLSCPVCARLHDRPMRCVECGSALVDRKGRLVPTTPAAFSEAENNLVGLAILGTFAVPVAAAVATGISMLSLLGLPLVVGAAGIASAWTAGRERRDADTRAALAAGRRPTSIREAIEHGGGETIAVRGELLHVPTARGALAGLPPRFAITDGTGAALIDDDSLLLWGHDDRGQLAATRTDELPTRGRLLVVGRARVASAGEGRLVWHGAGDGYRDVSTVLAFDGDARHRTVGFFERA